MVGRVSWCGSCQAWRQAAGWRGWRCAAWMRSGARLLAACAAAYRWVQNHVGRIASQPVIIHSVNTHKQGA